MRLFLLLALASCAAGEGTSSTYPSVVVDGQPVVPGVYPHAVKVDYMLRGYFYAGSEISEGLGGNASSENMPHPMTELGDTLTAKDGLHVLALVDEERPFAEHYDGFRVVLANASGQPVKFGAQDSRLSIIQEAVDRDGAWKPIEYLPHSWCGNSYHVLTLPPRSYWELAAPHYDGDFATRLRIRVAVRDGDTDHYTYSNEYASRINRGQFLSREGHQPSGLMDPYFE